MSLVPSFKIQIDIKSDDEAWRYFECHDVGDYDQPTRAIAADAFLAGTIKTFTPKWVSWDMTAGSSSPRTADTYYFTGNFLGATDSVGVGTAHGEREDT